MNAVTIKSNNAPRNLIAFCDLNPSEQTDFDYISEDEHYSYRLFRYKGHVYDTCEFMITPKDSAFSAWHGYQSDSYFSGIVIKYRGCERVIVGQYSC